MATYLSTMDATAAIASLGEAWVLRVSTVDASGDPSGDVAPVVTITKPDGSTATPVVAADVPLGTWVATYTTAATGRHTAHVSTADDALDYGLYVYGPTTAAGMPTVNDCVAYMGDEISSWSSAAVQDAYNAERAAQRARCGEPAIYPDDLREALLRRVQRNLAMRRLPLAVNFGDADAGFSVLPGRDPEVRRLEAPYRRMSIG